ncbi:MAG: penicillin-binding protein 2 [Rhodospirillales bacterium]
MNRDNDRTKLFTRRTVLLAGSQGTLLSLLCARLYWLQVVEAERYTTLADDNRISVRLLAPPRGKIYDRFGRPVAVNRKNFRVVLVAEQSRNVEAMLDIFARIIVLDEGERRRILAEVRKNRKFVPVTVREDLSWEEVARIAVNAPDLPGVSIEEGQSREYPHAAAAAHLLGYVAAVSERELTGDPLLETPGFRIGKSGVEQSCDPLLRGKSGKLEVEVNAVGRVIRELTRDEGEPGADINLTLDLELQKIAYDSLALTGQSGAVVLLDVLTGDVLALASCPGFDPSAFNRGLKHAEWRALISDPKAPLTNKAIAGLYAPGSTFKPVTALAALEAGAITTETRVSCGGHIGLGNARFHCWKKGGHGTLNLRGALSQSCDVYFYEAARRCGIDNIAAMAHRLGLGEPSGLGLSGERRGVMPTQAWKLATIGVPWQKGETLIAGIGQGFVLASPLQLAVMTARIAGGGLKIVPRLIDRVKPKGVTPVAAAPAVSLGLNPQHLRVVQEGMIDVVVRGTAHRAAIREPGMEMAGKTGTSQVRRISKAERAAGVIRNEDLPWERRDHALFIGYAPVHAPRYAVAVLVEHGGGGSAVAAPIARDVILAAQMRPQAEIADRPFPRAGTVMQGLGRAGGQV